MTLYFKQNAVNMTGAYNIPSYTAYLNVVETTLCTSRTISEESIVTQVPLLTTVECRGKHKQLTKANDPQQIFADYDGKNSSPYINEAHPALGKSCRGISSDPLLSIATLKLEGHNPCNRDFTSRSRARFRSSAV